MKRILCATDGSAQAEKAVVYAIELANQLAAELTFIHIVSHATDQVCHSYFWDSSVQPRPGQPIHEALEQAIQRVHQKQLQPVFCTTVSGDNVAQAISDYARRNAHDHLVMGRAGISAVNKKWLGSVAEQLIHQSHCPVTVVR